MKKRLLILAISCCFAISGCGKSTDSIEKSTEDSKNVGEDELLEEIYLQSVGNIRESGLDLFGKEFEDYNNNPEMNKFSINDVDNDGVLELIISWNDASMAGIWGGIYQYDFDKKEFHDEGVMSPYITAYDNGVVYVPWYHNQGLGNMYPFDLYEYNENLDKYEKVLSADSWDKCNREEGFPDDVDIDNVGTVYYLSYDSDIINYDNPVSKSEFDEIYNFYFENSREINLDYYCITEDGIKNYRENVMKN